MRKSGVVPVFLQIESTAEATLSSAIAKVSALKANSENQVHHQHFYMFVVFLQRFLLVWTCFVIDMIDKRDESKVGF